VRRQFPDARLCQGLYDGLIISGLLAVGVVVTNVAFPAGPDESDSDPGYFIGNLACYALLAVLLIVIGARACRRTGTRMSGAKGGAAGGVIAVLVTVTFLVVNNVFFDLVSQQHDKRVAFAASGWSSMHCCLPGTTPPGTQHRRLPGIPRQRMAQPPRLRHRQHPRRRVHPSADRPDHRHTRRHARRPGRRAKSSVLTRHRSGVPKQQRASARVTSAQFPISSRICVATAA
jgi:hypothetical protein